MMLSTYATNQRCNSFQRSGDFESITTSQLPSIAEECEYDETDLMHNVDALLAGSDEVPLDEVLKEDEGSSKPKSIRGLLNKMGSSRSFRKKSKTDKTKLPSDQLEINLTQELVGTDLPKPGHDIDHVKEKKRTSTLSFKSRQQEGECPIKEDQCTKDDSPPVVWVVRPSVDAHAHIRFKFSSEGGAMFVLKAHEAQESLELLCDPSCNTFFQLYSIDGATFETVSNDKISSALDTLIRQQSQPGSPDDVEDEAHVPTQVDDRMKMKRGPVRRIFHHLVRKRWRKVVRRQVSLAMGGVRKKRDGFAAFLPLLFAFKLLTDAPRARTATF